jgi:hypothetical protein
MKRTLAVLALSLGLFLNVTGSSVAQTTINFDDRPAAATAIPNGYQGFNWTNFGAVDYTSDAFLAISGYKFGIVSPANVGYNLSGNPAAFSAAAPFTLNSFYATAAWRNQLVVLVQGFLSGALVNAVTVLVDPTGPIFVDLDWENIDQVTIDTSGGTPAGLNSNNFQVVIDDMKVNYAVNTVPEGSSLAMLLLGGLPVGVGLLRLRKPAN